MTPAKPPARDVAAESTAPSSALFEQVVQRFEKSWNPAASFEQLLAGEAAGVHPEIIQELACIDLEFRWTSGQSPPLEAYLRMGQAKGLSDRQLHDLAFEDYRLRKRFGQPKPREWYAEQFQLDISTWPVWGPESGNLEAVERNRASERTSAGAGPSPELPAIGSSFHGCTLVGILGRGAFGCVYLARQAGLANRFVVLKVSPLSDHEPQLLAELQHTHIVPIYSFERDTQWQSICMPFLGLVTLADMRPDGRQLSLNGQELLSTIAARKADTIAASTRAAGPVATDVEELLQPERHSRLAAIRHLDCQRSLLWMFARIAEALGFAHSQGVVHGDIKPANILISDEGNPLLLDFHLASRTGADPRPEQVGGTLPYMSPQQLRALEKGDPPAASSDLFSLGVVMFELLGGRLPFATRGQDPDSIAAMIREREQPPPKLRQLNPALSVDLESIIEKCLAAERAEGYRSLRQVQEDLDLHLGNRPLLHAPNRSTRERISKWARRHPVLASTWSLTSLFLLLMVALGAIVAGRLQVARRLEANASSQRFVRELEAAVVPLTVPGLDPKSSEAAAGRLAELITGRYQRPNFSGVELLSETQRSSESMQLSTASFWLTQSALAGVTAQAGDSQRSAGLAKFEALLSPLAAQVPAAISSEFVELQAALQRIPDRTRAGEIVASELLQSKTDSSVAGELTPERLILSAARAIRRRDSGAALEQLERALALDADNYQAWLLKGHAWLLSGNRERASEAYSFCLALQPESPWGWFQRGLVRLEQGDFRGSRSDFGRCIELEPKEPTAWLNRALAARGLGDLNAALADLSQAIELGCSETRAVYLRSQFLRQLGRGPEAEAELERFLELEPSDLKSWLARGLVWAKRNEPDRALADFQAARQLVPDSVDAWQNIATVQSEMLKQLGSAVESLGEIVKLRPSDPIPLVTRGVLLGRMGERDAAHTDARNALRLRTDADVLFRAAGVYALTSRVNQQDAEQALELFRQAAFADPRLVLSRIGADADLQPIHEQLEYQQILASLRLLAEQSERPTEVKQ